MSVLIPLTALITPPVTIKAFDVPPEPPDNVHVPTMFPGVALAPVVIFVVFNVIILPVVTLANAMEALAVTVNNLVVMVSAFELFTA